MKEGHSKFLFKIHSSRPIVSHYVFDSAGTKYVNFSIIHWSFRGVEQPHCYHGGISIFEEKLKSSPSKVQSICTDNNNSILYQRNIYTRANSAIANASKLISYEYPDYGTLAYRINVSGTNCSVLRANLCKRQRKYYSLNWNNPFIHSGRKAHEDFASVLHDAREREVFVIEKSNCSLIQIFVKFVHECDAIPLISNRKAGILHFKSDIEVNYPHQKTKLLKFHIHGILTNKSALFANTIWSLQSYFTIFGGNIFERKKEDNVVTEIGEKNIYTTSNQNYEMIFNRSAFPERHFRDAHFLRPYMRFQPPNKTDWLFLSKIYTRSPTNKYSPKFFVSLLGDSSWVEISVSATDLTFDEKLELTNLPKELHKLPSEEAVMICVNKSLLVEKDVSLQINITLKVGCCFLT